jgi:hypothetical protein
MTANKGSANLPSVLREVLRAALLDEDRAVGATGGDPAEAGGLV